MQGLMKDIVPRGDVGRAMKVSGSESLSHVGLPMSFRATLTTNFTPDYYSSISQVSVT